MPKTNEDSQLLQSVTPWARPLASALTVHSGVTFNDTNARLTKYLRPLEQQGAAMLNNYKSGRLGPHDVAVHDFVKLRNELMNATRGATSPGAQAMAKFLKVDGLTVEVLTSKYAKKIVGGVKEVHEHIMKKSIETNPVVNSHVAKSRLYGITGLALLPGALAFDIYQARSEERIYETFRAASEVVGGTLAVWHGVPAMWAACKVAIPKAPSKHVVMLQVVFNLTAATSGSLIGGQVAASIRDAKHH